MTDQLFSLDDLQDLDADDRAYMVANYLKQSFAAAAGQDLVTAAIMAQGAIAISLYQLAFPYEPAPTPASGPPPAPDEDQGREPAEKRPPLPAKKPPPAGKRPLPRSGRRIL